MVGHLLPNSATAWERAVADAMDGSAVMASSIELIRGTKLTAPPPSFLPFLIYEYGLGELTPYVPNLYDLIAQGIDWQRLRGTPAAMALALAWLGYTAQIEEASTKRRFWNLFQLKLDRVRDDIVDLDRVAGVAGLSVPRRSYFWRGFSGYDIGPLLFSEGHWGEGHYGEYSGVRLRAGAPLWSFGRRYDFVAVLTKQDLSIAGVWRDYLDITVDHFGLDLHSFEAPMVAFEEVPEADVGLGWEALPWSGTTAAWTSSAAKARSQAMASGIYGRSAWFAFFDASNAVIGYRRARAARFVVPDVVGLYAVNGEKYSPTDTIQLAIYFECLTGFGDGNGQHATSIGLVLDAVPLDVTKPGKLWLEPDEISGEHAAFSKKPVDIHFGESIRERVRVLARF